MPNQEQELIVGIEQVQIEQDTAKTVILQSVDGGSERREIDLNRAGTGLMEIVSKPDMRTPEQAGAYVRKLQNVLRTVGASDGNMEQGSLRCDVNVSVNRKGESWGTRTEVKNVNSVRFIMNAVASEISRQIKVLQEGGKVLQETRAYDETTGQTVSLRTKEQSMDYRYMPDPNLPSLDLSTERLRLLEHSLPELPDALRDRLKSAYPTLSARDLNVLIRLDNPEEQAQTHPGSTGKSESDTYINLFEQVAVGRDHQRTINW